MPALRDYNRVIEQLQPSGSREERMQRAIDALWNELGDKECSWIGFYVKNPDLDELILATGKPKPACSPIGLHGACGRSFHSRRPLIVTNVANLRAGYIACDPRDRSEVVIPCMDGYGEPCWGVLDADSFDTHGFDERDVEGITRVLIHAGLHTEQGTATEVV